MKGKKKKNNKIIYILSSIFAIVVIIELIIILNSSDSNRELKQNGNNGIKSIKEPNYNEDITLGDIVYNSTDVGYSNSNSDLLSSTVQAAIDELYIKANNITIYKNEICPGCVYRNSTTTKYNSNASGANGTNNKLTSSEYTTDYTTLNSNYFLGYVIDGSGYILASYACGINNGTFFCLRGVDSDQSSLTYKPFYQEGVNRMNKAFPSCNATTSGSSATCYDGVSAKVNSNGYVDVYVNYNGCFVNKNGYSYCEGL